MILISLSIAHPPASILEDQQINRIRQATDNYVLLDSPIVYSRRFEV
ncbi:MAG: hypothetical protein ACYTXY_04715 [Nostoc sp.]